MSGEAAKAFYEDFLAELRKQHSPDKIKDGVFGEYMQVLSTMDFREKALKLTKTKICCVVEAD
jgi:hypothetical protein